MDVILCCLRLQGYYIRQRSWANVMYSPLFVCLLLCKIVDFCKVYWSPRFVTLQNRRFLQSILVTAVCLSAAFVRLFAMYRPHYWSDRSDFVPADVFWSHDDGKMF